MMPTQNLNISSKTRGPRRGKVSVMVGTRAAEPLRRGQREEWFFMYLKVKVRVMKS